MIQSEAGRKERRTMAYQLTGLGFTLLEEYMNCPKRFQLSQVLALPRPMPWSIYFGRCFHEALDFAFLKKLEDGYLPENKEVIATFDSWWDGGITEIFFRDRINFTEAIDWSKNDPEELRAVAHSLIEKYMLTLAPQIAPVLPPEVVTTRLFKTNEGDELPFISHLDLVTKDEIVDWKTSSRSWGQKKADTSLQATAYLWNSPSSLRILAFHVGLKQPNPEFQILRTIRTNAQLEEFEKDILPENVTKIRSGEFPRRESWMCNYCGYYGICR